ncbi:hypothetical protein [Dyadobacter frigoris]|uniref:hypothetical protein n=1 Tax=Dyadobacter frigoris TaxID=2576211 RepID=UPI0026ABD924
MSVNKNRIEHPLPEVKIYKNDAAAVRITGFLLVSTVWVSAGLFGLYILAFYAAALYNGNMSQWNNVLPGLYQQGKLVQTSGIGLHFASGGIILRTFDVIMWHRNLSARSIGKIRKTQRLGITTLCAGNWFLAVQDGLWFLDFANRWPWTFEKIQRTF